METRRIADVFLDTGHVVALADPRDRYHAIAREWSEQVSRSQGQVVTTRAVLVEIGNILSSVKNRSFAAQYITAVERAPAFEVVPLSEKLFRRGFELFEEREDKAWGLTGCISFVAMRDRKLRDALSADGDFQQAGFNALLRS